MNGRYQGKTALITGASRGIGKQLAEDLAAAGARCLLVARDGDALERNRGGMEAPGRHQVYSVDVSRREEVERLAEQVLSGPGTPDVLINNAGISRYYRFLDTPIEDLEQLMRTNYWGVVYCTRAFLPSMLERRSGHIVNISSIAGRIGTTRHAGYCASKFAVTGFSESLYYELQGTGVGITVVNPGVIATQLFDHASFADFPASARKMMKPPSGLSAAILQAIPDGKFEVTFPRSLWAGVVVKAVCPPLFRRLHSRFLEKG